MAAPAIHTHGSVWIGIDQQKKVADLESVTLRRHLNQVAEWFCHQGNVTLLIRFPEPGGNYRGSPFAESEFLVPKTGSVLSGPPKEKAQGEYKYDVYEYPIQQGAKPLLDPKIIIEP